ncbi:MAG: hypothetical protein JWM57_749 [Phycisphaerales bacterium]|nr:hypothetical protein [Phycisphaerales bacterium]
MASAVRINVNAADYLRPFAEPDPRYTPVPAWWWSGEKLHLPKMRWQMDQMRAMGLRNFVVIGLAPSGAMFGSDADDPPFLSEAWWDVFRQVCDYAREIGLFVWFYDQIGFSGANFQTDLVAAHPEWSAQRLKSISIDGEGLLEMRCPDIGTPIHAYFLSGDRVQSVDIIDRRVQFNATATGRLRLVYSVRQAYDYFNPIACQALLDTVHREYARRLPDHIGKTIVGSFQDELPELPTWGPTFADSFAAVFGYRLESVVHHLFEEGNAAARRTRLHFHQHRANLAEAAFFKPCFEWYESYGMQCGYDQQSPAREARVLGCIEKYADYMQTQRWYALPGSDLHGNGKLHASIAFLNDRPRVWLEGFHTSGWGGTLADTFDWLLPYLRSGVTLYNPHAIYYSTRKGWWEWAPPSTCWRQPYAMHYRGFAEMIARLTKLLSRGVQQASVGVLFPTATAQSAIGAEAVFDTAKTADTLFHEVLGSMRWHQVRTGALDAAAIDHHVLDEPAIQTATINGPELIVHGQPLRAIVLPAITMLHAQTLKQVTAFASNGGRVVVIGSDKIETEAGQSLPWQSIPGVICLPSPDGLADALADLPRPVRADVQFLHRRDGDTHILFVPAVSGMATVVKWDSWFAPMEHTTIVPERYRDTVEVALAGLRVGDVRRFDPVDGSMRSIATHATGDQTTVKIDFGGAPMAVLAWTEASSEGAEAIPVLPSQTLALPTQWACEFIPTLPELYTDIYDPQRPERRLPTTPTLRWMIAPDDASWQAGLPASAETIHATFGVRGDVAFSNGRQEPLVYSPQFGIDHDKLHQLTLGPKAHVPEEFIDLGKLPAGESATVRFAVFAEHEREVLLQIGANARKAVRHREQTIAADGSEYGWQVPLRLHAGDNKIELILTAASNATVRAFWCFFDPTDAALFDRPERLITPEKPIFGQRLRYTAMMRSERAIKGGTLLVASAAQLNLSIAGQVLGRQGGFDPYRLQMRGQRYAVPALPAGEHEVAIEVSSPASVAPVLVDAEIQTDQGAFALMSDRHWQVSIDGGPPGAVAIQPKQDADGAAWHLRRRPHPLPGSAWLDGGQPRVLDLPLAPPLERPATQWLEWMIPPGAISMTVPLVDASDVLLWIDGKSWPWRAGADLEFSGDDRPSRRAILRINSRQLGGGLVSGPITYGFGQGSIKIGNWIEQGLSSYSGAIRMVTNLDVPTVGPSSSLDLGRVRGTVEAFINGGSVGIRFMSPYRFDISTLLRPGTNRIELIVTNTLVNHLSTWSPTRCWSPDQLDCGVFGPVTVVQSVDEDTAADH